MDRLRKRRDFLAAAKALRAGVPCFLMQGRDRGDSGDVRIGFTVTKKTGNAVVRNRIRRRLREAVRHVVPTSGRAGHDYVLVAREAALHAPFETLVGEVERALRKLHDPDRPQGPGRGKTAGNRTPAGRKDAARPKSGAASRSQADSRVNAPRDGADTPAERSHPRSETALSPDITILDPKAQSADGGHPA